MHQRLWASITRAGATALVLGVILTGTSDSGALFAQTEIDSPVAKKTTEPVFRVPKVAGQESGKIESTLIDAEPAQQQNTDVPNGERVADSRNIMDVKPNLTKVIPAELPTTVTAPAATPAKAAISTKRAPHPLDRAVNIAEDALANMQAEVRDYTAIMAKREQINGVIGPATYMNVKVRCPRKLANGTSTPFSIYMKFVRPKECSGREVIWVQGRDDNKLIVHEGSGLIRLKTFMFEPTGRIAMNGQKYPIYDAGLENLILKLIEKADRDRAAGPCVVNYREGAKINKRPCSLIELVHEKRRAPYEFHKAQVFIDDELNLPVRFAAYDWPTHPGATPSLLEEYTYYNVKVNVGLTDLDFDRTNPAYKFR